MIMNKFFRSMRLYHKIGLRLPISNRPIERKKHMEQKQFHLSVDTHGHARGYLRKILSLKKPLIVWLTKGCISKISGGLSRGRSPR